jgi:hypothetical protein
MNRRKFLRWLGVGIAGAAVAPSVLAAMEPSCVAAPVVGYRTYLISECAIINSYANYVNFSDFALAASIDEVVANAAKELGEAAGRKVRAQSCGKMMLMRRT